MFIFLVFFADILDHLDDFISNDLPLKSFFIYYLYTAPTVFIVCLPIAVLLSAMRVFRNLSISNEYVALIMSGIPLRKMILPIAASALLLSMLSFYISDNIAPKSRLKRKIMQKEKFKINRPVILNKNLLGSNDRKYYLKEYYKNDKIIKGLMITITNEEDFITRRIYAEKAVWVQDKWEALNVKIQAYETDETYLEPEFHKSYTFLNIITPSQILLRENDPKYLNSRKLKSLIKTIPKTKNKIRARLKIDYYRKFSLSFLPFIIIFIAIPFAIAPVRTISSKTIGFGVIICLIYYIIDALFYQAGKGMLIPPFFAAWTTNLIFIGLSLFLLKKTPH